MSGMAVAVPSPTKAGTMPLLKSRPRRVTAPPFVRREAAPMAFVAVVATARQQLGKRSRGLGTRAVRSLRAHKELVDGPTVVITGASQGVGRAASLRFAKEGYNVVLAARSQATLEEAAVLSRSAVHAGRKVLAVECDITSQISVAKLLEAVKTEFREVRVLVCNAGVCMTGNFLAHSVEDFQTQLNVNFLGHVATVQAFLPLLAQRGKANGTKPTICFVNSFGARVPLPNMTAYCAAKYALQGFADSLRLESPDVHVATVHPGVIRSDFRSRAAWRGEAGERRKTSMDNLLDGTTPATFVTQSVEDVADAVFCTVKGQKNEVVVGPAFQAMLSGFGLAKAFGFT